MRVFLHPDTNNFFSHLPVPDDIDMLRQKEDALLMSNKKIAVDYKEAESLAIEKANARTFKPNIKTFVCMIPGAYPVMWWRVILEREGPDAPWKCNFNL